VLTAVSQWSASRRSYLDRRLWRRATEAGVRCAIHPDARCLDDLQYLAPGIGIARKGWLTKKDVVNCLPSKEVEKLLKRG